MSTIVADTICNQDGDIRIDAEDLVEGCAQGWINLSGIGFVNTGFTIRDQYNMNSVTDLGLGNYRFNFAQALFNNRYAVNVNIARQGGALLSNNIIVAEVDVPSMSTSSFEIVTYYYGSGAPTNLTAPFDPEGIYITCYATQNSLFLP